jgi:hypothetical protein
MANPSTTPATYTAGRHRSQYCSKHHKPNFPWEETAVKKRTTLSVSCFTLLLFALLTLTAFGQNQFVFSPNGRFVQATHPSSHITPAPREDAKLKVIAGNFSTYPNAIYFSIWGETVDQGVNGYPFQTWAAVAFTPTANATVTKIETSAGRQGGGTAGFELGLWDDSNGVPGKPIKSFHVANLPSYGTCCAVSVANDKAGIPVTAGTQYWVVVSTTPKDTDIYAWAFNSTDMRAHPTAYWCEGSTTYCGNNSGKWQLEQYVQYGFNVLGN